MLASHVGAPEAPDHLSAEIAAVWDELVPVLARANVLDGADPP